MFLFSIMMSKTGVEEQEELVKSSWVFKELSMASVEQMRDKLRTLVDMRQRSSG